MVSQPMWIAIVIVAFFIGIGASYAHFANTYDPMSMKFQNQKLFDQMMSHNPKMSQQWMDSDMMNIMMNDPEMQKMIMTTMHDSNQIQLMEDMMDDMMERMKTDPELEQAMLEHMARMKSSSDAMMENMDDQTMNDMMEMNP
jgi:CRP-like cAMP-binding protein